jgi:hypothetical protein
LRLIKKKTLLIIAFFIIIITITALYNFHKIWDFERPQAYLNNDGQIVLNGKLTPELLKKFKILERNIEFEGKRLVVRSSGGRIVVGVEIGEIVYKYNMDVEVNEFCISACANYIFTAGNNKYVRHDSGLIYHGGMLQKNMKEKHARPTKNNNVNHEASVSPYSEEEREILEEYSKYDHRGGFENELAIETHFFEMVGVNQYITIYGQLGEYAPQYSSKHIGFHYTIKDLKKFGVNNVNFIGEGDWRPHTNPYNGSPYWVKVDENILNSIL